MITATILTFTTLTTFTTNFTNMNNITVIGSGTMGNGIAHTFAQSGFNVALVDINREALNRATQTITANLDSLVKIGTIY